MSMPPSDRMRPWSAKQHSSLNSQAISLEKTSSIPARPASAMDRLRSNRDIGDPLTGIRKRNLYQAHARRIYSREMTNLDEQLDMLAASMRQGPEKTDHEKRVTAMAAHLNKQARDAFLQESQHQAAGYAGRRRPSATAVEPSVPLHIASQRAEESAKAYGHGATPFTRHEPEVEAEQWLEHMWLAKRTKDMVSRAQEEQVRKALRDWERQRQEREDAFENILRKRKQLRGSTLPMGCKSSRSVDNRVEVDSDVQRTRMERNLKVFETTTTNSHVPPPPFRQHSASTAEQLQRPKSAVPTRRAKSFSLRSENDASSAQKKQAIESSSKSRKIVPSHLLVQRRVVMSKTKINPVEEKMDERNNAPSHNDVALEDLSEGSQELPESSIRSSAGKPSPGTELLTGESNREADSSLENLEDRSRRGSEQETQKGLVVLSSSSRCNKFAWDVGEDYELEVLENAANNRAATHKLMQNGKIQYLSAQTNDQLSECRAILERFEDKGLGSEISAETLYRALVTPQDIPYKIAIKNLKLPGSTLPHDPAVLAAKKAASGKKGKKKGLKKKAGGAKKKAKKAGAKSGASSPKKGKKKKK